MSLVVPVLGASLSVAAAVAVCCRGITSITIYIIYDINASLSRISEK